MFLEWVVVVMVVVVVVVPSIYFFHLLPASRRSVGSVLGPVSYRHFMANSVPFTQRVLCLAGKVKLSLCLPKHQAIKTYW